jgi:hypothetical protein
VAQQNIAGVAVLIALMFMMLALAGCANFEQSKRGPANIAPVELPPGAPEFNNARIGRDTLRGHLRVE